MLRGGLEFDHLAASSHYKIYSHDRPGVLFVAEIKQDLSIDDPDTNGGNKIFERYGLERSCLHQLFQSQTQGDECPGDGSRSRASIGLDDVAIDPDRALSHARQIRHSPNRTPNEPLNLVRSPARPSFGQLAGRSR